MQSRAFYRDFFLTKEELPQKQCSQEIIIICPVLCISMLSDIARSEFTVSRLHILSTGEPKNGAEPKNDSVTPHMPKD